MGGRAGAKVGLQGGVEGFVFGPQPVVGQAQVFVGELVEVGGLALTVAGARVFEHAAHDAGRPPPVVRYLGQVLAQINQQFGFQS